MRRRHFLQGLGATLGLAGTGSRVLAQPAMALPYQRIECPGRDAVTRWDELRADGKGWPVIVGIDEDFGRVVENYSFNAGMPQDLLAAADKLRHPEDLAALRKQEAALGNETLQRMLDEGLALPEMVDVGPDGTQHLLSPEEVRRRLRESMERDGPEIGLWPDIADAISGPTTIADYGGKPHEKVNILLIPTQESATVPAFLKWGGWNACPAPQYHVAALRSWHHRYGAELVCLTGDVMELCVTSRPKTRDEALELAREQYLFCADIVDQGVGTLSALAAALMESDWWFFWWD